MRLKDGPHWSGATRGERVMLRLMVALRPVLYPIIMAAVFGMDVWDKRKGRS